MSLLRRPDALVDTLDPLVRDGTLTPSQADRVYQAMRGSRWRRTPAATTETGWEQSRVWAAVSVLAAGSLGACYLLAANVDEAEGFGWKTLLILLGVSTVLGLAAAAFAVVLHARPWARWAAGVLGALSLAAFAVGLLVLWDPDMLVYVAGLLMLAGGAAGYWFLTGPMFTVVAVAGGALVLGQAANDVISGGNPGSSVALEVGVAFVVYGLVIAAAGWRLQCRHLLGMLGLGLGLTSMLVVIFVDAVYFAFFMAVRDQSLPGIHGADASSIRSDIRVAMVLGLIIAALAALAHAYTSYAGFAVLAGAGAAVVPVIALVTLNGEHPLPWSIAFGVVGTVALVAVVAAQLDRRRPRPAYGVVGREPIPGPPEPFRRDAETIET